MQPKTYLEGVTKYLCGSNDYRSTQKSTMIYDTVNCAPEPVSFPRSNVRFCYSERNCWGFKITQPKCEYIVREVSFLGDLFLKD